MPPTPEEIAQAAAEANLPPTPAAAPDPAPAADPAPAPPVLDPAAPAPPVPDAAPAAETAPPQAPKITHNEPLLCSGSAGPVVRRLVNLLAAAGHASNTIILGENPGGVLDQSVMADVRAFCKEQGVVESSNLEISGDFVGPATWQAIYDAAERALQA